MKCPEQATEQYVSGFLGREAGGRSGNREERQMGKNFLFRVIEMN
jgi:hypothetical protein